MPLGTSVVLAQECDFPNIVNSFSLYGEPEGSFTLTDFQGGEAFTIETYSGTYSLKFRTCDGDYVLLYANSQEVEATCPNDFPSPGFGEAWELNSLATICHPGFSGPIDLTIEYTLGTSCSVWSQGCEDDGTTFQSLTPFDVQRGGGEYYFDNSVSITDLPSEGYLRIDMDQGDWVTVTAYASGQQIRFAHSPLWDSDGPGSHQAYVESCPGKATLHWLYRGQYQNINVALKPAASIWSSNCGSGTLVADSIVVTKVRKYMDCVDPATCGCKEYRACNYDASATYNGVCSFRNQHNERRANNNHYIDRFGDILNLSDGQPSAQFPSGLDFIELGRYAPAGLTSSGDLYYNGEWVASGIRCFDAVYNSVIAADSSGTLLAFGSGPIAQEPLPSTGSVAVQDIQLTYPFSASAATRAYALLDDGTVTWWPTYPAGNGDSYIEGQDQIPYAASQLANIEEIAAGADALYARDKAGYVHKVGSHNWSTDYPFYSPQIESIPEWAQSRIADITGVGYMHISFLLDDGRQLHLDASGISGDRWMEGIPHTMNYGFPFATSSGIYMDHAGQIRDANGGILAIGSLSTNCSGSSTVSPAEVVSCTDSTACNFGAMEPCQFWTSQSRKRFSLASHDIAVLDSLGHLHLWNLDANDTSYAIELEASLAEVVFEEIVATQDFGSSGFYEYGCGLDESGQVHTWAFPSYADVPSGYTDIPSSLNGKTVVRIDEGTGFIGALTNDNQLHIWGVGHWGFDASRQEWVINNVADFQLGGWHHDITFTDGSAEWIPTFENAPIEYINRPGFGPGVIAQWPGWLQYFDYGAVLYRNGQVGHFGSDKWEQLMDSIPEGTHIVDIAPGRCGDCAVALSNAGEIFEYGYAPWSKSEPTNLDGAPAVKVEGMWSGNHYYLGADGLVHLTPSQTYLPGGELDSIPASVFCECDDALPSATCPCSTDADGDGICDALDTCNDTDGDGICDELEISGCTDPTACNYEPNATDSAPCLFIDALGICGGDCAIDVDADTLCDDLDNCTDLTACNYNDPANGDCFQPDECGICGGSGIPEGECDCEGNQLDALGICGGPCEADTDGDGICDTDEVPGCTDQSACNFDPLATDETGSCEYQSCYCQSVWSMTNTWSPPHTPPLYATYTFEGNASSTLDSALIHLDMSHGCYGFLPADFIVQIDAPNGLTASWGAFLDFDADSTQAQWPDDWSSYPSYGDEWSAHTASINLSTYGLAGDGTWTVTIYNDYLAYSDEHQSFLFEFTMDGICNTSSGCLDSLACNFDENAAISDSTTCVFDCEGCRDASAPNFQGYPLTNYSLSWTSIVTGGSAASNGPIQVGDTATFTMTSNPSAGTLISPQYDEYGLLYNCDYPYNLSDYDCFYYDYSYSPVTTISTCSSQYWRFDHPADWYIEYSGGQVASGTASGILLVDGGYTAEFDSSLFGDCPYLYDNGSHFYLIESSGNPVLELLTWSSIEDWTANHESLHSALDRLSSTQPAFNYLFFWGGAEYNPTYHYGGREWSSTDLSGCEYPATLGCTDAMACNFDPLATIDNGTCESLSCSGCTDWEACNYCYEATIDNGTCDYESCLGCWDDCACNTSSWTNTYYYNYIDDGSCEYTSCAGCTDPFACNFDPSAILSSTEACQFPEPGFDCSGNCTGPTTPSGDCDPDQFACSPYPVGVDTLNLPSTYIAQVALSGDGTILALGLPNTSASPGQYCGAVQVWEKAGPGWTLLDSTLFGSWDNAYFGTSLDLNHDGTRLVVGSPANYSNSMPGAVTSFERIGSGYQLLGDTLSGNQGGSRYGQAVAIDSAGVRILVGAPRFDSDGASNTGLMQVFGWDNDAWSLQASFPGDAGDEFGSTVTISDDGLTCASGGRRNNGSSAGIVRAFRFFPAISAWLQRGADLTGLTNEYAGYYGTSLKLDASGLLMAIGAPYADHLGKTNCGRTTIYFWDGSVWTIVGQPIHGETAWDYSGYALDFAENGSSLFIGAYGNDGSTNCSWTGHVRNYRLVASSWQKAYPDIDGENASSQFGRTLAVARSGDQFVTNGLYKAIEVAIECDGCTDEGACNFDPNATQDDGSCLYLDECAVCGGSGAIYECGCEDIPDGDCDCDGNQLDAIGECGGSCAADADGDEVCDDVDGCVGAYDECGVCNGPGAIFECGCADIPEGDCDCNGNQLDAVGICGGDCVLDTDGDGVCDTDEIAGCTDETACNYNPEATDEDGSCLTLDALGDCGGTCEADADEDGLCDDVDDCIGAFDECGVCNGPGAIYECGCGNIPEGDCDCEGNQLDALGICGGTCAADEDADGICDDVDDCVGAYDECGVCNGPGAVLDCGCEPIPGGDCDCNGNVADIIGVCGGDCTVDFDGDGVCDDAEVIGCTYADACNFDPSATNDDGSCLFPDAGRDCAGNCVLDSDADDICDSFEIPGCTDSNAVNYHPVATEDDGTCDFDLDSDCYGDVDTDGVVGVGDILNVLANFGTVCNP